MQSELVDGNSPGAFEESSPVPATCKRPKIPRGWFGLVGAPNRQPTTPTPVGNAMAETAPPPRKIILRRQKLKVQCYVEDLGNDISLELIPIPGGSFTMGSPEAEEESMERERPQHPVTVQPFYMGRFPVTQAQWRAVAAYPSVDRKLESSPSNFPGDNRPVEQVSWDDAVEFCKRLSDHSGKDYRLPSEAQWEYACRAGTTTPFHFGETLTDELSNYRAKDDKLLGKGAYDRGILGRYREETTDVDIFPANSWGLHDMHGNVLEWCADTWHGDYASSPEDDSPRTDGKSKNRVLRGGSWIYAPGLCRSAFRNGSSREDRLNVAGFRVCCVAPRASSPPNQKS
ncbi:MAG: formylglycine-generating enzyme family protein [Cyanobacteria bacterium P01_D01_bin.73]